jgi:hypothetical protein
METANIKAQQRIVEEVAKANEAVKKGYFLKTYFKPHKVYGFEIDIVVVSSHGQPEGNRFTETPSLFTKEEVEVYGCYQSVGVDFDGGCVSILWEDKAWDVIWFDDPFEKADDPEANRYLMVYNKTNKEWFFGTFLATHLVELPEPSLAVSFEDCEIIETRLIQRAS